MPQVQSSIKRGQIWSCNDGTLVLIVSNDDWNSRRVNSVLALDVTEWSGPDRGALEFVFKLGEVPHAIQAGVILSIDRTSLEYVVMTIGDGAMGKLSQALRDVFSRKAAAAAPVSSSKYPQPGQVRFADLAIEGEGEKPVVIVSASWYAEVFDFSLVVACRMTSNGTRLFDYDVGLSGQPGKVVCSDVMTVSMRHVRERTTQARALTLKEREEVLNKVYGILGLSD